MTYVLVRDMTQEQLDELVIGHHISDVFDSYDWDMVYPVVDADDTVTDVAYADSPQDYGHLEFVDEHESTYCAHYR